MHVESNRHNYTFTSKNRVIRKADDIVRRLNGEYPRLSKTNFEDFTNYDKFGNVKCLLDYKTMRLRSAVSTRRQNAKTMTDMVAALPDSVEKYKMANCYESAELATIAAKVNGIKNYQLGEVISSESGALDHAVVIVNDKKNPYILDAWLGFADYIPNAVERFKKEFSHHFEMSGTNTEKIIIKPYTKKSFQEVSVELTPTEKLRTMFPKLCIDKK